MAKEIKLKTSQNNQSVHAFLDSIEDKSLRADSKKLLTLFKKATNLKPKMWGTSIVGFGSYVYHRSNGDQGEFMATGFSPRKSGPVLYIMPGYTDYSDLLTKLGKHKLGKSCLYLKSVADVDQKVLEKLIKRGLKDLKKTHQTSY